MKHGCFGHVVYEINVEVAQLKEEDREQISVEEQSSWSEEEEMGFKENW